ncbi:LAME_0H14202g1_1 [Lachancea meyersii CBS 8951]|uniref:Vacuolar protein sorting-associated protein 27 n=1 Tax=Lachancea meyersii CBS 8951 TaxID=1266667 RepID=A0A1G4KH78_9SACH|nr:LAME_0H14202g1_1 [Lachancea meyersii CBS 8951]
MSSQVATPAQLESLIQKATSESIPHGAVDLTVALEVSDVIKSRRIAPRDAMRCIKKRIMNTKSNPNTQLASWTLTEMCLKNCGTAFIREVCSREFMDPLERTILDNDGNEELELMCKGILQNLYTAFKNDSQLGYVSRVYQRLLSRGIDFPPSTASDLELAQAMFDSKAPADWVDSDVCMICSTRFTLLNRKHHCRSCGGIFCQEHSSNKIALPDLGLYEPVRVCDDCYREYDHKRLSDKKHQKKSKRSSKRSSQDVQEQEDEELRRAIELSLRESHASETFVPVVPAVPAEPKKATTAFTEEEQDEDLKAAIEASLREAEEQKKWQEAASSNPYIPPQPSFQQEVQRPTYELSASEEDDIYLFATLVERMKSQPASAVLGDTQLQQLYQKVMGSAPKLNYCLNDASKKYNTLVDVNSKISDIMNIYDSLLEKQLQSINLNQQYSLPQLPSDPYAYYNVAQQESPMRFAPTQQAASVSRLASDFTSTPKEPQSDRIPDSMPLVQNAPEKQEQRPNYADDLQGVALGSPQSNEKTTAQQRPYPDDIQELANVPSEPIYQEDVKRSKQSNKVPYPAEEESAEQSGNKIPANGDNKITNFDFPTVPLHQPPVKEDETVHSEDTQDREELLIEL